MVHSFLMAVLVKLPEIKKKNLKIGGHISKCWHREAFNAAQFAAFIIVSFECPSSFHMFVPFNVSRDFGAVTASHTLRLCGDLTLSSH